MVTLVIDDVGNHDMVVFMIMNMASGMVNALPFSYHRSSSESAPRLTTPLLYAGFLSIVLPLPNITSLLS